MVGGKRSQEGSQKRAIRQLRDRGNFTGFPSEVTGRESFGRSRLAIRRPACVTRSGGFTTLEEAVAFLESTKGPSSEK